MAKAKQINGGLVPTATFGDVDRMRVRALATIDAATVKRRKGGGGSAGLPRLPGADRCRHCKARKQCKPRGLCYPCHTDAAVRGQYPPDGQFGAAGLAGAMGEAVLLPLGPPARPTHNRPGTVGKLIALILRYERRETLWHPDDMRA